MSFLSILFNKTPETLEQSGDDFFKLKQWGKAKIEYEHALDRLEKTANYNVSFKTRLEKKISHCRDALAENHYNNANELIEGEYYDEAKELILLALELSNDSDLKSCLEKKLKEVEHLIEDGIDTEYHFLESDTKIESEVIIEDEEEHFFALCGTLPEEVQNSYLKYGNNFKKGYVALNRGEFDVATSYLERAMEEDSNPHSYIPLELATAYVNIGRQEDAQKLLETFLDAHPDVLPAYQLICEILWENKSFGKVDVLLSTISEELAESVAVHILKGETFYRAGKYTDAQAFYQSLLDRYGWNETIALAMAKVLEAMDKSSEARIIYKKIMDHCQGCHSRIDPFVKHRYAELSFAVGEHSSEILELYLSLVQEIPDNASAYFDKISQIYTTQGYREEARRFRSFSQKTKK